MNNDLTKMKFEDFSYGSQVPDHLNFLPEARSSWHKVFKAIVPQGKKARRKYLKRKGFFNRNK